MPQCEPDRQESLQRDQVGGQGVPAGPPDRHQDQEEVHHSSS